jgi:alpha-glucosidase/alpha-D-xyloside xylohydrolase
MRHFLASTVFLFAMLHIAQAETLTSLGQPAELTIRPAGEHGVRVTLMPLREKRDLPENPALVAAANTKPVLRIQQLDVPAAVEVGGLKVTVRPTPLRVSLAGSDGAVVQELTFREDGGVDFLLDGQPVLGLGGGGPKPEKGEDWRKLPVEFDRRGRLDAMQPRWQSGAYGSRNPVPLLVGTGGWGLFFAAPWGRIDLREVRSGRFLPVTAQDLGETRQTFGNQQKNLGKGLPPRSAFIPGFLDVFVFGACRPANLMKDISTISGAAAMPPKWALGYMQSHRTLEDDAQMVGIVETFREKRIPLDAVIYLGTGFTPRGWNTKQPSFAFNPEVFKREPERVLADLHALHAKVVLHMVPWDRDKLPVLDAAHMPAYWKQHEPLVKAGVDGWWPDEGDWLDLYERLERHRLYHDGPLSTQPDRRPWSLHRNGTLGIARWGGWIWSGDTNSAWKTLEAQIAVGLNSSLSLSPYWGSDIGGFFTTPELAGELYARWFQFGAFCPSFRSHGQDWWARLPWAWGLGKQGAIETKNAPPTSALNDPEIEKITRRYAELRYQLLSYTYSLAWRARETGLPFMRALWLHYPDDAKARGLGTEYLWGRDLLVAPVFEKGAKARSVYLPAGVWYDWWTGEKIDGGREVTREVDLATMPLYVRAGAIIPLDPVRQYTGEPINEPLTLRIYPGADGDFALYEDDGSSLDYLKGKFALTRLTWNDKARTLTIEPGSRVAPKRTFQVECEGAKQIVSCASKPVSVVFNDH